MDINATFKAIAQYRNIEAEAKAEREKLEAMVKEMMTEEGLEELLGDEHKATYKEIVSNRFDSSSFKKDYADMYKQYTKASASMRFTFV